ncbi:MAG: ATP-binding protein [Bryobacteraceae bacterium]
MLTERAAAPTGWLARWTRVSLRGKSVAVLAVPLAALFAALALIYFAEGDVANADQMVTRFYDTRAALVGLRTSLGDAEVAMSGYLAARQDYFLAAYQRSRQSVNHSLDDLARLTYGTAEAVEVLKIRRQAAEEIALLDQWPKYRDDARALEELQKASFAERLGDIGLFTEEQERRFFAARYLRDVKRQRLLRTVMACGVLGPLVALFMHLIVSGRMVRRIQAVEENARLLALGLPLDPFPSGTDEIAALARQLDNAAYLLREREREVLESEARYRDLFDRAPIAFEEADCEGVVRRFNQAVCGLLKCPPDRLLGRHAWDFVAPDQQEAFRAAMLERMATGAEISPFACDYILEDGSGISVEVRESLVRNNRGEITGMVRSLLDVTERNLAEVAARKVAQYALELRNKNEQLARALEAARSATEAKSRFLASVSHELRTPLNGIIGFSELMHDGKLGPVTEEHKEVLGDILTSARHLLQLINDVLDLSKVEAGKMEFRPEPSRIQALVYEVCDVMRPLAERKGIVLSVETASDLTAVIDPSKFKQVLYNYLSNAVKFTPQGGKVAVRATREENSWLRLEVEDTGIGIAPQEIGRLFQEFQQLPNNRNADQGTGLGLALTRHIVEAQGGSVALRSILGCGSVFSAVLPLVTVPTPGALNSYGT